ncbi:nuclear transport factor 2 family protein [Shewanella sp. Scap07]|uniref:nuclear transport factor 2 family protein n=1 Tax=Shewanella sp. Scap07 TaxID=2589987 RepID=UPI0015BEC1FE|nr:nuclear transport factor 2 family protein [Shewanella sp. Scap07]QLE86232.1 nuclear transport factor 2 family protein [Shewanella sp. Scap07]
MNKLLSHKRMTLNFALAFGILCLTLTGANAETQSQGHSLASAMAKDAAAKVLDKLHHYAADADWDNYFALYSKDAVFIGTDAAEYWDMKQFASYARPTDGWRYQPISRRLMQFGDTMVFDELLDSQSYGTSRGTGTLILNENGWQIAQYHLSFPIPNDIAKSITQQIKTHEAGVRNSEQ